MRTDKRGDAMQSGYILLRRFELHVYAASESTSAMVVYPEIIASEECFVPSCSMESVAKGAYYEYE